MSSGNKVAFSRVGLTPEEEKAKEQALDQTRMVSAFSGSSKRSVLSSKPDEIKNQLSENLVLNKRPSIRGRL